MLRFITFVFLLLVLAISVFSHNLNEPFQDDYKYVVAKSGLRMRDSPNLAGNKLVTIPFGEKVRFMTMTDDRIFLAGEYGSWTQVNWNGNEGWVFGGFLRDFDIKVALQQAEKMLDDHFSTEQERASYVSLSKPPKILIGLESVLGNAFVLRHHRCCEGKGEVAVVEAESVFYVLNGKVQFPENQLYDEAMLTYLNDDEFPDYLAWWSCCMSATVNVFIGGETGFEKNQGLSLWDDPSPELKYEGQCRATIKEVGEEGAVRMFRFSCDQNQFVLGN